MIDELKPCPYMEIKLTKGKVTKVSPDEYALGYLAALDDVLFMSKPEEK